MSSFLNQVKSSLSGKPELDEASKAILEVENKKRTIIQASKNEQDSINLTINKEYQKIGEVSYGLYKEGNFEATQIQAMFDHVTVLYQTLAEKQSKLKEILGRYDEELKILRPESSTVASEQDTCAGCGTSFVPGKMQFCRKCGSQLVSTKESVSPSTYPKVCSHCNTPDKPDAVFCSKCGSQF